MNEWIPYKFIQGDQKVCVRLTITIQKQVDKDFLIILYIF